MTTRSLAAPGHAGSWRRAGATACCILFVSPAMAAAQLITVKSAPVADAVQFGFLPSANLGMGGLSVALADSTLDPFVNPAKGARIRSGTRFFGSPTFYSISRQAGGGLTLPIGAAISSGPWFGQVALAMQEVDHRKSNDGVLFPQGGGVISGIAPPPPNGGGSASKPSRQNRYLFATLGRRLPMPGVSVAGSVSWSGLHAIDGVELFYPGSQSVRQRGDAVDVRLGLLKEGRRGQSLEAVAVHNRFGMTQDVAYSEFFWDPSQRQIVSIPRLEPNADRTETWGMHLAYTRPLPDSAWRIGGVLTANRIKQPSLPGYDIPQVPGDAGRASAYDVGGGIARSDGRWTLGADAIFEPIWSRTWARASAPIETQAGGLTIAAGENTLENRFRYTNAIVRAGLGRTMTLGDQRSLTLEGGGQLRAIRYRLDQWDVVQRSRTASHQGWDEWTRSWGASLHFSGVELQYRGRLTTGAGRPGVDTNGGVIFDAVARPNTDFGGGFIDASGRTFGDVRVTTHQISLSLPIR